MNNINPKPIKTPAICGTVARNPNVAPDDASIKLFGPGVHVAASRMPKSAIRESIDIVLIR